MPYISDAQLARVQTFMQRQRDAVTRAKNKAEEKAGEMKSTLECVGAAAGMGLLRGKMESSDGTWNLPFLAMDVELLTGLALVSSSLFDLWGKYDEDVLNAGNGILAHYMGQITRKWSKTGSLSLVAGQPAGALIAGQPGGMSIASALSSASL